MKGVLRHICISESKGVPKSPVPSARVVAGHGIDGDAHAGFRHRQVSLLAVEDIEQMREKLPGIRAGSFAENLGVECLELGRLGLGSLLRVGPSVVLEISQRGKVCHNPCAIYRAVGDCIMPRAGLFAEVLEGGEIRVGDEVVVERLVPVEKFQVVVITVSDSRSAGAAQDATGPAVAEAVHSAIDAHIYRTEIVPDDEQAIRQRLEHYCDGPAVDLVLTAGGTGFAPRDVTPEATRAVIERPTPGLDEAMRRASAARTPFAVLSRGVSGIRGRTLIINLPGSPQAAVENFSAIAAVLDHALRKLRGDTQPCAATQRPPAPEK